MAGIMTVEDEQEEENITPHSIQHHSAFTRPLPSSSTSLLYIRRPAAETRNGTGPPLISQQILHPASSYNDSSAAGKGSLNGVTPLTTSTGVIASAAEQADAYKECLRNHAASLGGHILDGCCEYMPRDVEDPLRCAACGCHRSFHRKETNNGDPVPSARGLIDRHQNVGQVTRRLPLPLPTPPPGAAARSYYQQQFNARPYGSHYGTGGGVAMTESSSEEITDLGVGVGRRCLGQQSLEGSKKRSRTKFTVEQKERMLAFAERVGWRIHKQDEVAVRQFCSEVSVSRQALKVWMHNNKSMRKEEGQQQQDV